MTIIIVVLFVTAGYLKFMIGALIAINALVSDHGIKQGLKNDSNLRQ
jgi:hypothetical protein